MNSSDNLSKLQRTLRRILCNTTRTIKNKRAYLIDKKAKTLLHNHKSLYDSKHISFGVNTINNIIKRSDKILTNILEENKKVQAIDNYIKHVFERGSIGQKLMKISLYYANYQKYFGLPLIVDLISQRRLMKHREQLADLYYKRKYGPAIEKKKPKKSARIFTPSIKQNIDKSLTNLYLEDSITISNFSMQREESMCHIVETVESLSKSPKKKEKSVHATARRLIYKLSNNLKSIKLEIDKKRTKRLSTEPNIKNKDDRKFKSSQRTSTNFNLFTANTKKMLGGTAVKMKANSKVSERKKLKISNTLRKSSMVSEQMKTEERPKEQPTINININNNFIFTEKLKKVGKPKIIIGRNVGLETKTKSFEMKKLVSGKKVKKFSIEGLRMEVKKKQLKVSSILIG